jgi:reactive chlorine resistance protein C
VFAAFFSRIYDILSIRTFGSSAAGFKPWFPKTAVLGGLLASLFFVVTISFMITTTGIGEASAGGFPSDRPTDSSW